MSYKLETHRDGKIVNIVMSGRVTVDDFAAINAQILDHIATQRGSRLTIVIDTSSTTYFPENYDALRRCQSYIERPEVKTVVVVTRNKFTRLMLLLAFHLAKPYLYMVDDCEQAEQIVDRAALV